MIVHVLWAQKRSQYCFILGHALHEQNLQRQQGVGTVVRSQERRAAVVPPIIHLPTADQPFVLFFGRFT